MNDTLLRGRLQVRILPGSPLLNSSVSRKLVRALEAQMILMVAEAS